MSDPSASVAGPVYHAGMYGDGANLANGIDEVLALLRADKDEAEIDWILDSAYENGRCLVDGDRLFYDGRDFWIEPVDWGGVDPYEVDGPVDDLADWTDVLTRSG